MAAPNLAPKAQNFSQTQGHENGIDPDMRRPGRFQSETLNGLRHTSEESERFAALWERALAHPQIVAALGKFEAAGDNFTREHTLRDMVLGGRIAARMNLSEERSMQLLVGLSIHDLGKLQPGTQLAIYNENPPTDNQWRDIRRHPDDSVTTGLEMGVIGPALGIAGYHHAKRRDPNKRYAVEPGRVPDNERDMLLEEISSVVDAYDAMQSERPGHPNIRPKQEAYVEVCTDQIVNPAIYRALGEVIGALPHPALPSQIGQLALQA